MGKRGQNVGNIFTFSRWGKVLLLVFCWSTCHYVVQERSCGRRRYPEDSVWSEVAKRYMTCSEKVGTPELLTSLALGKISSCPFPPEEIGALKQGVIGVLRTKGLSLGRHHEDRCDVPFDLGYLSLLLQAAQDPESAGRGLTRCASWARGPTSTTTSALSAKEEVEIAGSRRPLGVPGRRDRWDPKWRQNYSSITEHASRVLDVLNDQSSRGQTLKLPEPEARLQFPHLVVASLGAQRKDKPGDSRKRRPDCSFLISLLRHWGLNAKINPAELSAHECCTGKSAHSSSRPRARARGFGPEEVHDRKVPERGANFLIDGGR